MITLTEYSKTSARHLMLLLTKFCSQNLNTLLSEVKLKTGLAHIWATELKRYHLVRSFLKCKQYFVGCLKDQYWGHSLTFHNYSKLLDFHLFADDANLFFMYKDLKILESEINSGLGKVHIWLFANKLNQILLFFIQYENKFVNDQSLTEETSITNLVVYIDSNISWKSYFINIAR